MAEVNPPSYMAGGCYSPGQDRRLWESLICGEGVIYPASGALQVTLTPEDPRGLTVAPGQAWITGTSVDNQGIYHVVNDGEVNLAVTAPDLTDDRIDQVVATLRDGEFTGSPSDASWELQVVRGEPSTVPVPPPVPVSSLVLASITVAAGASSLSPADITDNRQPPTMCPGYEAPIERIPDGADLDDYIFNGTYYGAPRASVETIANWPNYFGQSYSGGATGGNRQAVVEVFEFSTEEAIQRVTETIRSSGWVIYERHKSGSGAGEWGDWYVTGGPGRWGKTGIYSFEGPTWAGNEPTAESSVSGMRKTAGMVELSFRVRSRTSLSTDSVGNVSPNIQIGFINNPSFRPETVQYLTAAIPGIMTLFVRVGVTGVIKLSHGSIPNHTIDPTDNIDIQGSWPAPPNI